MNPFTDPLLLSIAFPLVVAIALLAGAPRRLAYVGFGVPALLALWCWLNYSGAQQAYGYAYLTTYVTGLQRLGITLKLGLNGVSLPLFVMAALVGLSAGLYALQSAAERPSTYLALLLIMFGGLMGVFASVDIFFLYFFHELALIPTFIMVGVWGGRDRGYAAMKMTIYLTLGALISLVGLIALYVSKSGGADTFDLIALRQALASDPIQGGAQKWIFGLLLVGFGILVSLWPFHTWAPLGYGAAPSSASMLHAGVLKKFGLYGLIQVALPLVPQGAVERFTLSFAYVPDFLLPARWEQGLSLNWIGVLAFLAVIGNLLIVGFTTIAQRDLKQMVGYSSVMHMGYAFLGIATLSTMGLGGVVLMMVAHGLSVALLFLLTTSVYHRTQTFEMADMGGLAQKTPVLAAYFVAATLASIGLPGFANFWGELTIFTAAWKYSPAYTACAVAGVVISAIYGLRAAAKVFFGQPTEAFAKVAAEKPPVDLTWGERLPALILLAALLAIGFWPKSLSSPLNDTLSASAPVKTVAIAK